MGWNERAPLGAAAVSQLKCAGGVGRGVEPRCGQQRGGTAGHVGAAAGAVTLAAAWRSGSAPWLARARRPPCAAAGAAAPPGIPGGGGIIPGCGGPAPAGE